MINLVQYCDKCNDVTPHIDSGMSAICFHCKESVSHKHRKISEYKLMPTFEWTYSKQK